MKTWVLPLALLLMSGCSSVSSESIVQQRMSTEYNCPVHDIRVKALPAYEYRGDGCGHTSTFICLPQGDAHPVCTKEPGEPVAMPDADAGTK